MPALNAARTILIVEDDPYARVVFRRCLEGEGYRVLTSDSGRTALAELERERGRITLLLADLLLPDMDGREVVRQAVAADPALKVILVTGVMPSDPDSYPLLVKPFRLDDLLRLVAARLRLSDPELRTR